jgi:hypothetical protein
MVWWLRDDLRNGSLCGIPTVYCARILLRMLVGLTLT